MATDALAPALEPDVETYRSGNLVIAGFVSRGISKTAAIVGYAFAAYAAASLIGFTKTYKTAASRAELASLFGNNPGLKALFGASHSLNTARGFTAWRTLAVLTIVGGVWALMAATKRFRGEEEAGHTELFLSGTTTPRAAAASTLAGLTSGLVIIYMLILIVTLIAGKIAGVPLNLSETLFYALALVACVAEFFAVGAFTSQISPTRRRAATVAAAVFGVSFVMRAIGDASASVHWLTYISPLGWIEHLRPLTGSSPIWLLPIAGFVGVLCAATVYVAGARDLGASLIPDKDSARARTRLLNGPFGLAVRQVRSTTIAWCAAIAAFGLMMGSIAKSAGKVLESSSTAQNYVNNLTRGLRNNLGTVTYLAVAFLVMMVLTMAMGAAFMGSIREEEAEGYLENLLVRPVSRMRWLVGRLVLVVVALALAGLTAGVFTWFGAAAQRSGVSFNNLVTAGINAVIPAAFIIGIGMLTIGLKPRWTSAVTYGVIGWSFLLEMIGPAVHLNHWVLDTSLMHHVALAPAADVRWSAAGVILGLGLLGCIAGALLFNRRDLAGK
jgi:ABC-2 type transport system permease protein